MMSKYIEPWSRRRFASAKFLDFLTLISKANEPCLSGYKLQLGLTGMTPEDLLLLLSYAKKLQETQRNLEEVCNLMQHKVPLEGLISAQDNRTLQSAKSCLQRLHVRVEALANVLEQTLISQQLQFMHAMAQHCQTSNSIVQFRSDPCDAPKESKPGNGLKGPDDKEVMTRARNLQRDDAFVQAPP